MRAVAYNRYRGNSGRAERVEEPLFPPPLNETLPPPSPPEETAERPQFQVSPSPPPPPPPSEGTLPALGEGLGRLLRRLSPRGLETEDLLLLGILYLLYRETGDRDFLIMLGGVLFL